MTVRSFGLNCKFYVGAFGGWYGISGAKSIDKLFALMPGSSYGGRKSRG